MKKIALIAIVFLCSSQLAYSIPQGWMDASPVGKGMNTLSVFNTESYQSDNFTNANIPTWTSNINTYLFDSTGTGAVLEHGLQDDLDAYVTYSRDSVADNTLIGSLIYPISVISTDSTRMLYGYTGSIGLKYSFMKSFLDAAAYFDYEQSLHTFNYKYTAWLMPPANIVKKIDHTKITYTFGLTLSKQRGSVTPFATLAYRSFSLEEKASDLDIVVGGYSTVLDIGFKCKIFDNINLYVDQMWDNQDWGAARDDVNNTVAFEAIAGHTSTLSYGLVLII